MENTELLERLLAAIEQSNDTLRKEILEGQESLAQTLREEFQKGQDTLRKEILEGQESLADTLRVEFREGQDALRKDMMEALDTRSDAFVERIDRKIKEAETRINIKIENEVDGKLKALFDGYYLNHDQNERQDARIHSLDSRVERLEIRMDILEEHRTA